MLRGTLPKTMFALIAFAPLAALAQEPKVPVAAPAAEVAPDGLVRLSQEYPVWVDRKNKQVICEGVVTLREGRLEMFACPKNTKDYESVIAINSKAYLLHAGLLAAGAVPGKPAQWEPKYVPASGTIIDIFVEWTDDKGKVQKVPAQEWLRDVRTGKKMSYDWVFAGSGFWVNEKTGEKHYHAEMGDLICVSNFATAMLDLPVESSQSNDALAFEPFTEHIPAKDTKVKIYLVPRIGDKTKAPPKESPKNAAPADKETTKDAPK